MVKPRVLAFDPGTHRVGFCLITESAKVNKLGTLNALDSKDFVHRRLGELGDEALEIMEISRPSIIAVEQVWVMKGAKAATGLAKCVGIIGFLAHRLRIPLYEVPNTSAKKALTGSGRADKDQMRSAARNLLGLGRPPEENAADALAIALYTWRTYLGLEW